MKKVKLFLLSVAMMFGFAAPVLAPVAVSAATGNIADGLCAGGSLNAGTANCSSETSGATDKVNNLLKTAIDLFSFVVGAISVVMIIIGGLKYITSGGDSGNVTGAKNTILYAVIGLIVVALAQVIVKFVLGKVAPIAQ